jgi:hypothetical protein
MTESSAVPAFKAYYSYEAIGSDARLHHAALADSCFRNSQEMAKLFGLEGRLKKPSSRVTKASGFDQRLRNG